MKRPKKRFYKRKTRKTTSIYEIRAGKYFYIGKSNNPYRRLEAHKTKAVEDLGPNKRKNKIFRANLRNLKMRVIARPKMKDWRAVEIREIAKYRKKYGRSRVLNQSDGGDGASGGNYKGKGKKPSGCNTLLALVFMITICACLYAIN